MRVIDTRVALKRLEPALETSGQINSLLAKTLVGLTTAVGLLNERTIEILMRP